MNSQGYLLKEPQMQSSCNLNLQTATKVFWITKPMIQDQVLSVLKVEKVHFYSDDCVSKFAVCRINYLIIY